MAALDSRAESLDFFSRLGYSERSIGSVLVYSLSDGVIVRYDSVRIACHWLPFKCRRQGSAVTEFRTSKQHVRCCIYPRICCITNREACGGSRDGRSKASIAR